MTYSQEEDDFEEHLQVPFNSVHCSFSCFLEIYLRINEARTKSFIQACQLGHFRFIRSFRICGGAMKLNNYMSEIKLYNSDQ